MFKNYLNDSSKIDLKCRLKYLQACVNAFTEVAKEKYHNTVNTLLNTQKKSKVYWSLLKIFLNYKKISITPPLFYENRFITDFKEKFKLLNFFFSKQCSLISNNSSLPADVNYITGKHLFIVTYSAKDIGKIVRNLDSNIAHEHDNISLPMLKICSDYICLPSEIFKRALLTGVFSSEWKKGNIVPVHKNATKKILKIIDQF